MTTVQIIHGDFQIADPDWPRFTPRVPGAVYTSDGFSTSGELVGSMTDVAHGGLPMQWTGRTGGWAKNGGTLQWVSTGEALIEMTRANYELSFDVVALPTAGQIYLVARRPSSAAIENNHYRIDLTAAGALALRKSVHGSPVQVTTLGQAASPVVAGDTVALRVEGDQISALVNGVPVVSATDGTYTAGGWAGLHSTTSAAGATLDNLTITAL